MCLSFNIRFLTLCFSFSQTRKQPTLTSPLKLVATVKLTPNTHTSYPIFILLMVPHPWNHWWHPYEPFTDQNIGLTLQDRIKTGSLQAGAVGTAPVVRPSLDCPGLVWRPTAGQAGGAGRRPETETRFGAEWPSPPPPQYSPSRESLVWLIGTLLFARSLITLDLLPWTPNVPNILPFVSFVCSNGRHLWYYLPQEIPSMTNFLPFHSLQALVWQRAL